MKRRHNPAALLWRRISVGGKMNIFTLVLAAVITVSLAAYIYVQEFATGAMGEALSDIAYCEKAQEAMEAETTAFKTLVHEYSRENQENFDHARRMMERALANLPFNYKMVGAERYARTWNLRNAYDNYAKDRDKVIEAAMKTNVLHHQSQSEITSLYAVYNEQDYIDSYIRQIEQLSVVQGSDIYQVRAPILQIVLKVLIALLFLTMVICAAVSRAISRTVVRPVIRLSQDAVRIGKGDFSEPDIVTQSQDEVGDLVRSFNQMKHATAENIRMLQENQELEERVHSEELEKIQLEKQLESTRLDLLQSQIHPHFLFNTLNSIAGMAELEDADTTRRMIMALSNLFRYNLHTTDQLVTLSQEISVLNDYMFLQKMRFGDRLQYSVHADQAVKAEEITLPAFLLQPLAENAVVHGLSPKEEGGSVDLDISICPGRSTGEPLFHSKGALISRQHTPSDNNDHQAGIGEKKQFLCICVRDTGIGMEETQLQEIRNSLQDLHRTSGTGIGLGNTNRRLHSIYKDAAMEIDSRRGEGTAVTISIPMKDDCGTAEE